MIIVPLKEGENIERALKRFKRKFEKTGAIRELRARKNFVKPSVRKREQLQKAIYVQHQHVQGQWRALGQLRPAASRVHRGLVQESGPDARLL